MHKRSKERGLHSLIISLFSEDDLRRFIIHAYGVEASASLPARPASVALLADSVVIKVHQHGIENDFFNRLRTSFPGRLHDIEAVATLWSTSKGTPQTSDFRWTSREEGSKKTPRLKLRNTPPRDWIAPRTEERSKATRAGVASMSNRARGKVVVAKNNGFGHVTDGRAKAPRPKSGWPKRRSQVLLLITLVGLSCGILFLVVKNQKAKSVEHDRSTTPEDGDDRDEPAVGVGEARSKEDVEESVKDRGSADTGEQGIAVRAETPERSDTDGAPVSEPIPVEWVRRLSSRLKRTHLPAFAVRGAASVEYRLSVCEDGSIQDVVIIENRGVASAVFVSELERLSVAPPPSGVTLSGDCYIVPATFFWHGRQGRSKKPEGLSGLPEPP